jgi:alkylhydroperoxidase family enzyme
MMSLIFGETPYPIRSDLDQATDKAWNSLGKPGNWWTGAERAAFVAEVRSARGCRLCADRVDALSPYSVQGEHEAASALPAVAIEAAHRLTTDAARLSEKAIRELNAAGLTDEAYVEIVSIVSTVMGIDSFCDALEIPLLPLPEVQAGEPSRYRPEEAVDEGAWVAMIPTQGAGENEADLYAGRFVPNVLRAMSLVPDAVRNLLDLLGTFYLLDIGNLKARNSLDRRQIELVAARVSALNECFY